MLWIHYGCFGFLQFKCLIPYIIGQDLWNDMGLSEDVIRGSHEIYKNTLSTHQHASRRRYLYFRISGVKKEVRRKIAAIFFVMPRTHLLENGFGAQLFQLLSWIWPRIPLTTEPQFLYFKKTAVCNQIGVAGNEQGWVEKVLMWWISSHQGAKRNNLRNVVSNHCRT